MPARRVFGTVCCALALLAIHATAVTPAAGQSGASAIPDYGTPPPNITPNMLRSPAVPKNGAEVAKPPADAPLVSKQDNTDKIVKVPNYNLVGVTAIQYGLLFDGKMFGQQDECKVDQAEWHRAIEDFVNKSGQLKGAPKLKFISLAEHSQRQQKLRAQVDELTKKMTDQKTFDKGMKQFGKAWNESRQELNRYAAMPYLEFIVDTSLVGGTCVANVRSKVHAPIEDNAKYIATGQKVIAAGYDMWDSGYYIKAPPDQISASITKASIVLLIDFLDEWTRASCLGPSDLVCR